MDGDDLPAELRELDAALRGIRFEPRTSLGPEIEGRLRRETIGDKADTVPRRRAGRRRATLAAVLVVLGAGSWLATSRVAPIPRIGTRSSAPRSLPDRVTASPVTSSPVTIDRCCFDLDGGGLADDGLRVLAADGESIRRVSLYEDLDGSRTLTPGDLVRYR